MAKWNIGYEDRKQAWTDKDWDMAHDAALADGFEGDYIEATIQGPAHEDQGALENLIIRDGQFHLSLEKTSGGWRVIFDGDEHLNTAAYSKPMEALHIACIYMQLERSR